MKKEYDEIMDHIEVTPEMRQRILRHIQEKNIIPSSPKVLRFSSFKKYLSVAACFVVLLAGAIALPNLLNGNEVEPPVLVGQGIEEAMSIQELSELVGFEIKEEFTLPFTIEETMYSSYWNELAEIRYTGGGQSAVYRQSPGTDNNSGDYNSYKESAEISAGSITVTLSGDGGTFSLAVWTDGDYAYSLRLAQAVTADEWNAILCG